MRRDQAISASSTELLKLLKHALGIVPVALDFGNRF